MTQSKLDNIKNNPPEKVYPTSGRSQDEFANSAALGRMGRQDASSSSVTVKTRTSKDIKKAYYVKTILGGSINEIQAYESHFYRLLLGNMTPKSKALYKDDKAVAVGSKAIDKMQTLAKFKLVNKNYPDQDKLIAAGLGRINAACDILEEYDLHAGNIGLVITDENQYNLYKFDHDRSMYSITKKYDMYGDKNWVFQTNEKSPIDFNKKKFNHFFPFYERDEQLVDDNVNIEALQKNAKFQKDVFDTCLKFILIPNDLLVKIRDYTLSNSTQIQKNTAAEIHNHRLDKIKSMRENLLLNKAFSDYLVANKSDVTQLINNWTNEFSSLFKNDHLKITEKEIDEIKAEFEIIVTLCVSNSQNESPVTCYNQLKSEQQLERSKNILNKIKEDILTGTWDIGILGGEKIITSDGSEKIIPKGMNEILTEINKVISNPNEYIAKLDRVKNIVSVSEARKNHGFFNQRAETTQEFYTNTKAMLNSK